jgi:hypothetical protein
VTYDLQLGFGCLKKITGQTAEMFLNAGRIINSAPLKADLHTSG